MTLHAAGATTALGPAWARVCPAEIQDPVTEIAPRTAGISRIVHVSSKKSFRL